MLTACLGLTAGWLVPAGALYAQDQAAANIVSIEFTGLARTSETYARDVVRIKVGEAVDRTKLDQAITRLLRSGRFLTAAYELDETADGVKVTFKVDEHPVVTSIRIEGNTNFATSLLKERITQKVGSPVDFLALRDGQDSIAASYRESGYDQVTVTYDRDLLVRTGELLYRVVEGDRVRIRQILFDGGEGFPESELRDLLETKTAFWILRSGAFDSDRTESDTVRLRRFFRDQGYLDAKVSYRTELSEEGGEMTIVFAIDQGTRYTIEAIQLVGNNVLSRDELLTLMGSKVGQTVKLPQIDDDSRAVQERYGELGHIYAAVRMDHLFSDTPGLVRIVVQVREGEQFRVGKVIVRGNARTKDKVVRRALNLYPPDDLFDLNEAKEAEKRLMETRIFGSARVYPVGNTPGVRDAVIDVEEAERVGDFLFGAGVTSNSGLVGNIVLDLQNFDIDDWPRNFSELIRFRSFFGAGQHMRLELQPGTELARFRFDFTEPYLFDKPVRFDTSLYLEERGRDGYVQQSTGVEISLGKRYTGGRLHGWYGELALQTEFVNVEDVDLFASKKIRKDEGSNLMASVKVAFVRDRTDSRFVPTVGDRLRFSYEHFVGDHQFGKATASYTWYKTIKTDELERKTTLQLKAEGGALIGDAPVFTRFFAGGTGSVRGFKFRGIGERHGIDKNNIGGDYLILLGGEYAFPLMGNDIRGLVFLDTGSVGSGSWRAAFGAGVRFTLNLFGPVPLELNVAFPISSDEDDDKQVFSFQIGRIF